MAQGNYPDEERHFGTVTHVDEERGFTKAACDTSGHELDVYIHHSVASPSFLNVGDSVAFFLHYNSKGQPQASAPVWKLVGRTPRRGYPKFGPHIAKLLSLTPKGNAFLECADVSRAHGTDPCIHSSVMQECDLEVGDSIAFTVSPSSAGMVWVSSPCWKMISKDRGDDAGKGSPPGRGAFTRTSRSWTQKEGTPYDYKDGKGRPPLEAPDRKPNWSSWGGHDEGRWKGGAQDSWSNWPVKGSWHDSHHVPWRRSEEVGRPGRSGSWEDVSGWGKGRWDDGGKGRWDDGGKGRWDDGGKGRWDDGGGGRWTDSWAGPIGSARPALPDIDGAGGKKGGGKGSKGGKWHAEEQSWGRSDETAVPLSAAERERQAAGQAAVSNMRPGSAPEDMHFGTVTHVSQQRGFCKVQCSEWNDQDVYVHHKTAEPTNMIVGDVVAFKIHHGNRGPQASAPLWKLCGWAREDLSLEFWEHLGKIIKLTTSGHGVVFAPTVEVAHGKTPTVHSKVMEECGLTLGDIVCFTVYASNAGPVWVSAPCWKCCSDESWVPRPSAEDGEEDANADQDANNERDASRENDRRPPLRRPEKARWVEASRAPADKIEERTEEDGEEREPREEGDVYEKPWSFHSSDSEDDPSLAKPKESTTEVESQAKRARIEVGGDQDAPEKDGGAA